MNRYELYRSPDQKAARFPVTQACKVAEVSTSGFYDWCFRTAGELTDREIAEAELVELIDEIFDVAEGRGFARTHPMSRGVRTCQATSRSRPP